jgi:hypothetical protein
MTSPEPIPALQPCPLPGRIRLAGRVLAVLLCGLHAWVARHVMNPDGLSYLDLADAYARGDYAAAVNSYWSPLYSWILGAALAVLRPSPYWECAAVHAVNFGIFLVALAGFEFLLTELLLARRATGEGGPPRLPEWAVVGLGYGLFIWVSRRLVTVSLVTPDMLVAAAVYTAAGLLLRMRRRGPSAASAALLGVVLGLGYLAKAVLFPLALIFLAVLALTARGWRSRVRSVGFAAAGFFLVAGGFIGALSANKGRPTFGDSGRLNYAWYVAGVPRPHWIDRPAGAAGDRPRLLLGAPAVYEFDGPGTYPLWYDPPRWYEGLRTAFSATAQLRASAHTAWACLTLLFGELACFAAPVLVLYFASLPGRYRRWAGAVAYYPLLLPALAAVALYVLVGHVEARLIGPFLLLLLVGMASGARVPGRWGIRAAGAGLALATLGLAVNLGYDARNVWRSAVAGEGAAAQPAWGVAEELRRHGLPPGARVGFIGFTFDAYWARLGGYRLIAEIPEKESALFWQACPQTQARALDALREAGASVVVAGPDARAPDGWTRVPGTRYCHRPLLPAGRCYRDER